MEAPLGFSQCFGSRYFGNRTLGQVCPNRIAQRRSSPTFYALGLVPALVLVVVAGLDRLSLAQTPPSASAAGPATPAQAPGSATTGTGHSASGSSGSSADSSSQSKPAVRRRTIPTTPLEIAEALGPAFLTAFVASSVIALWFTIERLLVLRRGRVIPRPFVERFLQNLAEGNLDPDQALRLCEENGSPVATVFAHGIRKWGKPSVEVEQAVIDGGERQVSQLRSHLRALNAVATITPLLGLLGTVIGMIQCFNEIAGSQAMGKADQLAAGIAIALLTTAAGLFIAIVSLTMYLYLAGRADALVMDMDLLAQDVVHLISAEAIAEGTPSTARARGRRTSGPPGDPKERKAV